MREIAEVAPGDAVVKVILTRGVSMRGYAMPREARPTRIVAAFPAPSWPASHADDGVVVRRCSLVLSSQPRLAGAKTLNRLENVIARAEWADAAIAEGLLGDDTGHVIEGTMSNVFAVADGKLVTPRLDRCGVIGAQRERVKDIAHREGIPCEERELRWDQLKAADEVFLTNSLIGLWPVARFDERRWDVGPIARLLQARIAAEDARA